MAKIFLVDLENVNWNGLLGLNKCNLSQFDEIYIFHNNITPKCPLNIINEIVSTKAKIKTIEVETGPRNALDFQLACFLGNKAKDSKENEFFIISKDKSYSVLKSFLSPIKFRLIKSFREVNKKETKNKFTNLNTKELEKIKLKILENISSNNVLKSNNYKSLAGSIFSQLTKSDDLEDFKNRIPRISRKKTYREEIVKICSGFF